MTAPPLLCRHCRGPLTVSVADLGVSPLANSNLDPEALLRPEPFFELHARLCERCRLVQLPELEGAAAIFSEYDYFSSYSESWLRHAARSFAAMAARFGLDGESLVVEVASNDGYLLRNAVAAGVPCYGIEPAANIAAAAEAAGIPTVNRFLTEEEARAAVSGQLDPAVGVTGRPFASGAAPLLGRPADLVVANNVFAHVPALNDFTRALAALLAPEGVVAIEVQHLLRLLESVQFDTIYHEHFQYYSLHAARNVLEAAGLRLFDVEELESHGGSMRLFCCRREAPEQGRLATTERVDAVLEAERAAGLLDVAVYQEFEARVRAVKRSLLRFLMDRAEAGERVVGYGAPAKGNTLLNYCGVGTDLVEYTVDRSPHKQGRYLPGSRLPIHAPERIFDDRPDWLLILPWNLEREIVGQMAGIREWGGRFVVAIPETHEVGA